MDLEHLLEIAGRAKACLEMEDLSFDHVQQFYQKNEEEDDATQAI